MKVRHIPPTANLSCASFSGFPGRLSNDHLTLKATTTFLKLQELNFFMCVCVCFCEYMLSVGRCPQIPDEGTRSLVAGVQSTVNHLICVTGTVLKSSGRAIVLLTYEPSVHPTKAFLMKIGRHLISRKSFLLPFVILTTDPNTP